MSCLCCRLGVRLCGTVSIFCVGARTWPVRAVGSDCYGVREAAIRIWAGRLAAASGGGCGDGGGFGDGGGLGTAAAAAVAQAAAIPEVDPLLEEQR
ncbi:unnamed protein product [Toxocara canis]|uniref:Secreted protein n=1 Tax=Toxocara canis TaxID=6265 RepID=A0A183TZ39_TOXCA|nr:unnamed protein product [Toxocara canis]